MKEIWKDIPGYEGLYQISDLGRVKSFVRLNGGILKQADDSHGCYFVGLCKNKKVKQFRVSVVVAMAFLGHTPCGHKIVVDHINNNSADNRLENLQLITHRENLSKDKKGYTSKYVGVSWYSASNKWRSKIQIDGIGICLGYFDDEIEAAKAYQDKLTTLEFKEVEK